MSDADAGPAHSMTSEGPLLAPRLDSLTGGLAILATAGGENAHRWILANALAWAVAMPVIFFGMDHVPWGRSAPLVWATLYVVCGASGLLVGAIHGRFLVTLVDNPSLAPTD